MEIGKGVQMVGCRVEESVGVQWRWTDQWACKCVRDGVYSKRSDMGMQKT